MNTPNAFLALALGASACDAASVGLLGQDSAQGDSGTTEVEASCDLQPLRDRSYPSGYPNPALVSELEDTDAKIRNTMVFGIGNNGDEACLSTIADLSLYGTPLATVDVPRIDGHDSWQGAYPDVTLNGIENQEFGIHVDPEQVVSESNGANNTEAWNLSVTQVGCVVRGKMVEDILLDNGASFLTCEEQPFDDEPVFGSYCPAMQAARYSWNLNGRDSDGDGVYDEDGNGVPDQGATYSCANNAEAAYFAYNAYGLSPTDARPCENLDEGEWYTAAMNRVQERTGAFDPDQDGQCDPAADLTESVSRQIRAAL